MPTKNPNPHGFPTAEKGCFLGLLQMMLAVFLVSTGDGYRGIYWKGEGNNHRTPSLFIHPNSTTVSFRASTTRAREAWNTFETPLPIGRWCHVAVASRGDGLMVLCAQPPPSLCFCCFTRVEADQAGAGLLWCSYIDGFIDTVFGFADALVANEGPLYIGRDVSNPGLEGLVAGVDYSAAFLPPKEVGCLANIALVRVSVRFLLVCIYWPNLCVSSP